MSCWVVVPIKALDQCKTRLSPALPDPERFALVRSMLDNVLRAAEGAAHVDRIALLGPERHDAPASITLLADVGPDLNGALARVLTLNVERVVIVPADLPRIGAPEIEALAAIDGRAIALAPDRAGSGTNALSLPLPAARSFRFQFGENSFARHLTEAEKSGLPLKIIRNEALEFDIDTPEDLLRR